MGDLSQKSNAQALLASDDTSSLTSFPDPSTGSVPERPSSPDLNGLLDRSGPTIFDQQPSETTTDAHTLSSAPPHVLQSVIDHQGAVFLVRRLSTLLAERDAHITALTRLAEEYKIPQESIAATTCRVKQAEQTRLALVTAADEEHVARMPPVSGEADVSRLPADAVETSGGTVKGITRLFGGGTVRRREGSRVSPGSSRSTSRVPPASRQDRPQSIDTTSIKSTDSGGWAAALFSSSNKRHDSRTTKEPVELATQHDKDQLPPTLSKRPADPQDAAWNKFLMRLAVSRSQSGNSDQANGIGLVGASHFGQEGKLGEQKMKTLTQLVIGGIPMTLRHNLWMELSNTEALMEPGTYSYYLSLREDVDQSEIDAIAKDVPRTLTSVHQYYANQGDKRLKEVLVAFVSKYESLGYTQGLNTIAGYLCLAIPEDEHAFWMLCNMVDKFFPDDYFSRENSLIGPLADSVVLRSYVKELMPQLAKRMDELDIPHDHTVPLSWFFTAFSSALPENVLMRVWDIWLCLPGQKSFLFHVALAILMQNASGLIECEDEGEYWSYMDTRCKLNGGAEWVNDLMKQAFMLRKKVDGIDERRTLETKVLRKKRASTEALFSPDE
ncbi:hypothetical protein KC340_g1091 [Hortaea werneckii]|nr:hypothetical protein KC342_g898 [Hortaea werneckii]KAI7107338.1 hypothetical protein KC339_g2415 [Hortaea werneckii]KAI7236816.1 hypothetical protein KC365_g5020 [Hortaea werneckii]KAI7338050.1 hypothetical protein KC340_g1091 [Hortaea werneckii]KAI7385370.1 hypothetical protein KC328_g10365 [Hortaea werneckii]